MGRAADALGKLAAAFNEPDEELRRHLLSESWSKGGRLAISGAEAKGRDELAALIGESLKDPEYHVRMSPIREAADQFWAIVRVRRLGLGRRQETVQGTLSSEGLIADLGTFGHAHVGTAKQMLKRLGEWAIASPAPALGVLGGGIYLMLRLPLGLFYGDLGVTPEELGFGPQILVPQSILLLLGLVFAVAALIFMPRLIVGPLTTSSAVASRLELRGRTQIARRVRRIYWGTLAVGFISAYFLMILVSPGYPGVTLWLASVPLFAWVGQRFALRQPGAAAEHPVILDQRRRGREERAGLQALAVSLVGLVIYVLLLVLPYVALLDADSVRSGGTANGRFLPWRAIPAQLRWKDDAAQVRLNNSCRTLRYLGQDGRSLLLFDTRLDQAFRIPLDQASIAINLDCPRIATKPVSAASN